MGRGKFRRKSLPYNKILSGQDSIVKNIDFMPVKVCKGYYHANYARKLLAFLLAALILFSGCASQEEGNKSGNTENGMPNGSNQGSVQIVEPEEPVLYAAAYTSLGIPAGAYGFHMAGNSLYAMISDYGAEENHFYKEVIGDNASALELMTTSTIYEDVLKNSLDYFVSPQDYLYFLLMEEETGEEQRYYLVKCASGGRELARSEITEQMAAAYAEGDTFQNAVADSEGRIYVATHYHIYLYDGEGVYQGELADQDGFAAIGNDRNGTVYYTKWQDPSMQAGSLLLVEIDFEGKGAVNTYQGFPEGTQTWNLTAGTEYDFLIKDNEYLYGYRKESQTTERILKWLESDVLGENIVYVCQVEDGEFLAFSVEGGYSTLQMVRFVKWDESMAQTDSDSDREIITLGALFYQVDSWLEDAVIRFNRSQDEYKVEIKEYGETTEYIIPNFSSESKDGLMAMTLELVAGKGPDLILYNSEFRTFAKRRILEDLGDYLEKSELLSRGDYLESALDCFTYEGRLTALPDYVSLITYYGYSDQIGEETGREIEEFMRLQQEYPDIPLFEFTMPVEALTYLVKAIGNTYIDWETGTCSFESEGFRDFLEFCKNAHAAREREPDAEWGWSLKLGEDYLIARLQAPNYVNLIRLFEENRGRAVTFIGEPVKEGEGSGTYVNGGVYPMGIYSLSEHKEGAWAFLEYLQCTILEEEYANANRFPARISYLEQYLDGLTGTTYSYLPAGAESNIEHIITLEEVERIKELLASASGNNVYSSEVIGIISEEAAAYFAGDKSVEEVMRNVQNRVQLYVSENY